MDLREFHLMLGDEDLLNKCLERFSARGMIRKQAVDESEIGGHLEKAGRNLEFVKANLKLGYFDWCVCGCYYAVYHASLALILAKGRVSKNHDATLCVLMKEYYERGIDEEDLRLLNGFFLSYQDLLFYVQSKRKRHEASYSTKYKFDEKGVEKLRRNSILFVNKAKDLLEVGNE